MKIIKIITTFLLLFIIGIFTSYANVKYNNWTGNFIKTFEQANTNFKFYNIKINSVVDKEKSEEDIKNMCSNIVKCFGMNEDKIKWDRKKQNEDIQIFGEIKDNYYKISFASIKKNNKEYYIIVDILSNKVYKNIVDIYQTLDKSLNKYSDNVEISLCIVGEYTKNLQLYKCNDILKDILYNMSAKEIDRIKENNFVSVTAYSKLLAENDLQYLDNKVNLNIVIRYSENEDKNLIYIATPIIKLDY